MTKALRADKKGCGTIHVLRVRICLCTQQQSEDVSVVVLASYVQWSRFVMLALVDICICLKKIAPNSRMTTFRERQGDHRQSNM